MVDISFCSNLGMICLMPEEQISVAPKSVANSRMRRRTLSLVVPTRVSCDVHECGGSAEA